MYFQSRKLTNIFYFGARFIHSLAQPIATKHPRALICVYNRIGCTQLGNYLFSDSKVSGTIAHETGSLHVHVFGLWPMCAINFSRDQSSDKLINFLNSQLDPRDSILETIEDRVSRDCQLTFERYCILKKISTGLAILKLVSTTI